MLTLKFGLPRLSFEVFQTKTKTELFLAISVLSKGNVKSNDLYYVDADMSKKPCAKLCFRKRSGH